MRIKCRIGFYILCLSIKRDVSRETFPFFLNRIVSRETLCFPHMIPVFVTE